MKDKSQLIIGVFGILEIIYFYFYNQTKTLFGYEINSFLFILFWITVTIFYFFIKEIKAKINRSLQ